MNKHYHFIGIGGIGMSALASLLLDKGYRVSGSDIQPSKITESLQQKGADIFIIHAPKNIVGADCVIYSSAITKDNAEFKAAKNGEVPLLKRAQLLAFLMEGHIGITVAGAHGKTTTSSMIANLLKVANFQPTTAVGGIVSGAQDHGSLGAGDYFVTEADESDRSFLNFSPFLSVITNIDLEHIDQYPDWDSVLSAFKEFISKTDDIGKVIAFGDDDRLLTLLKNSGESYKTYGFLPHNMCRAENIHYDHFSCEFDCIVRGRNLGKIRLNVTGRHNIANALACISVGLSLALDFGVIRTSLGGYYGVDRRFQLKGRVDDVWVIDDYAHHPTEIRAILQTAQQFKLSLPGKANLIAIFQPHRYTRVKGLMDEFAESLSHSDQMIITDIYAASEEPIRGVSGRILSNRASKRTDNPVRYLPQDKIIKNLLGTLKPNDVVLTLGAGDITRLADELVTALKERSPVTAAA